MRSWQASSRRHPSSTTGWTQPRPACPWILRPRPRSIAAIKAQPSSLSSGTMSNAPFPNGIPGIEVPSNQPDVSVTTNQYQSTSPPAPIPPYAPMEGTANSAAQGSDLHVLVYVEAGGGNNPALYEMWDGLDGGPWTVGSNALWANATSNALTPQGNGTPTPRDCPYRHCCSMPTR